MFGPILLMLAGTLSFVVDPSQCRQVSSRRTGGSSWNSDGQGHLSISLDAHSQGEVSLECKVRVPEGVRSITLTLDHVLVSFQPAASKNPGSGLVMRVGPSCTATVTRVAGEDWIEARSRQWTAAVPAGARTVLVRVGALDDSDLDPVRIDVSGLVVRFGDAPADCP